MEQGLAITGLARLQAKAKFRAPDHLSSPSRELGSLTDGRYHKVSGFRAIGPHLDLESSQSPSFRAFLAGLKRCLA